MKKRFRSGDIFQISLPNNLGFAFAKGMDLLENNPDSKYPVLVQIFNYRMLSLTNFSRDIIKNELILSPLLIAGILPAIKKGTWKIVDNVSVSERDFIIPEYKTGEPDEINARIWYYLIDADISRKVPSVYENVKHLESIGAVGSELVGTKIAMALLKDEGKEIRNHFKLEEYFEQKFHDDVVAIPAYYKQPDSMKGRAIR